LAITVIYAVAANRLDGAANRQDHDQEQDDGAQPQP